MHRTRPPSISRHELTIRAETTEPPGGFALCEALECVGGGGSPARWPPAQAEAASATAMSAETHVNLMYKDDTAPGTRASQRRRSGSTPESEPSYVILVSQVGAVPAFGNASVGRRLPFT